MANKGINKVIIIGNLGKDPDVRHTNNGNMITTIAIATSETWKDQNGEQQERTEWHKVVFYRKLAEIVEKYSRKGSKMYVEGKLQTRKWQDNEGRDRYTTEIIANEMHLLDSKNTSSVNNYNGNSRNNVRQMVKPHEQEKERRTPIQEDTADSSWDEEIPF